MPKLKKKFKYDILVNFQKLCSVWKFTNKSQFSFYIIASEASNVIKNFEPKINIRIIFGAKVQIFDRLANYYFWLENSNKTFKDDFQTMCD